MTQEVKLAGWEAKGLRCPDHNISFEVSEGTVHPISLLQMPNGTGKTTTLTLLRAALSGVGPDGEWTPDAIRDLRKNVDVRKGSFQVSLLHNDQRVTISLQFDFDEPSVRYNTTVRSGNKKGFTPPRELARFLNPSFVNFFIFDGELADSLLDRNKTNAERVIDDLFQLTIFDQMAAWVDTYWKDQTATKARAASTNSTTEKGLNKWKGWIDRFESRLEFLQKEQARLILDQRAIKTRLTKLRNESDAAIKAKAEVGKQLSDAEEALKTCEDVVRQQADTLLHRFRDPHALSPALATDMIEFKESLDRVKLPESAARDFFEELAQEDFCVCGTALDENTRQVIRTRAKQYLGSDDVALLNNIKSEIGTQLGKNPEAHSHELDAQIKKLQEALKEEAVARTSRDAIKTDAVHQDPTLEQKEQEIEKLHQQLARITSQLDRFEDNIDTAEIEDTWGIRVVEARLDRAKTTYAQIADTLTLKCRCETLVRIIKAARLDARRKIGEAIVQEANSRIHELMPTNLITIDRVDRCLRLGGGKGGGSAGETLTVSYAFLSTLFNRAEHRLPFIVDYPAGPLDHPKRTAVANLIPRLSGQFVAFTISTEREGFQDRLQAIAPKPIQYITLFRSGDPTLEAAAGKQKAVERTVDGTLVQGREFFEAFQLEEENHAISPA